MHYTLNQLQIFLKIAQTQSVTKAAEELHLTQPAVSIQLKNFQEQFEIPLTEVVSRRIYITDFGKEIALYSMITYLAASRTLDFIVEGIEEYIGVTIVAAHSEDIRQMIINDMGRGVTMYMGKRGFGKHGESKEVEIIYTVITRLELNKLTTEIEKIEPNAFVVMNSVKDTKGGMIKKRPLQH